MGSTRKDLLVNWWKKIAIPKKENDEKSELERNFDARGQILEAYVKVSGDGASTDLENLGNFVIANKNTYPEYFASMDPRIQTPSDNKSNATLSGGPSVVSSIPPPPNVAIAAGGNAGGDSFLLWLAFAIVAGIAGYFSNPEAKAGEREQQNVAPAAPEDKREGAQEESKGGFFKTIGKGVYNLFAYGLLLKPLFYGLGKLSTSLLFLGDSLKVGVRETNQKKETDIIDPFENREDSREIVRVYTTRGRITSTVATGIGVFAGMKLGAVFGGILGSVVPGIGTAVGIAAGTIIGAIYGGGLLNAAWNKIKEYRAQKKYVGKTVKAVLTPSLIELQDHKVEKENKGQKIDYSIERGLRVNLNNNGVNLNNNVRHSPPSPNPQSEPSPVRISSNKENPLVEPIEGGSPPRRQSRS